MLLALISKNIKAVSFFLLFILHSIMLCSSTLFAYQHDINSQTKTKTDEFLIEQFIFLIKNHGYEKEFYKNIIGKDIKEFNLTKAKNSKGKYEHFSSANEIHEPCPYETFYIYTLWSSIGERNLRLDFKKGYEKITALDIYNKIGPYKKMKSKFVPRFYDDCTMGYYNETLLFYNSINHTIIFKFDTGNIISYFYKNSGIKKYADDPKYENLKKFISKFDNIQNAGLKEILILPRESRTN